MAEPIRPNRPAPVAINPRGFTLIELLIVVAIIAILAAIAVPNFLAAQTRSKYSRVLAEFRTIRTAIESYSVDWNKPPAMSWGVDYTNFAGRTIPASRYNGEPIWGTMTPVLTTPVAYLNRFDFMDPFVDARTSTDVDARLYTYQDLNTNLLRPPAGGSRKIRPPTPAELILYRRDLGSYWMLSVGPSVFDLSPIQGLYFTEFYTQYDPSNGTISGGTIYVSQKNSGPAQMDIWNF